MSGGLIPELSIGLAGLDLPGDLGAWFAWTREAGYRAVQLNGAMPGARPRDLGRSARRDIAAMARRAEVLISGVDLWVPPEHFVDPSRADRAVTAACECAEFAAEMVELASDGRRAVLSLAFPEAGAGEASMLEAAVRQIAERAQRAGASVADHRWPAHDRSTGDPIGVGLDPASVLASGGVSPAKAASQMGSRLRAARLSDLTSAGMRAEPGGEGARLDIMAYMVALSTAGYAGSVVVDVRRLPDPARSARRCADLPVIRGLRLPG